MTFTEEERADLEAWLRDAEERLEHARIKIKSIREKLARG